MLKLTWTSVAALPQDLAAERQSLGRRATSQARAAASPIYGILDFGGQARIPVHGIEDGLSQLLA
jgi:hypothetical protein